MGVNTRGSGGPQPRLDHFEIAAIKGLAMWRLRAGGDKAVYTKNSPFWSRPGGCPFRRSANALSKAACEGQYT